AVTVMMLTFGLVAGLTAVTRSTAAGAVPPVPRAASNATPTHAPRAGTVNRKGRRLMWFSPFKPSDGKRRRLQAPRARGSYHGPKRTGLPANRRRPASSRFRRGSSAGDDHRQFLRPEVVRDLDRRLTRFGIGRHPHVHQVVGGDRVCRGAPVELHR